METKDIEIFEKYIIGELNDDELKWFNSELNSNPEFARNFAIYQDINKVLANKKYSNFRLLMKEAHNENFGKKARKKIFLYRFSAAAASLLILITTSYYIWFANDNLSRKDEIFSTYYSEMTVLQSSNDNSYIEAVIAYKSKNFKDAELLFTQLCKSDTSNSLYKFNIAMAYLAAENYTVAEKLLLELHNPENEYIDDNSQWFLGVIYYKTKNYKKAKTLFKQIADKKEHFKSEDAKIALEIIEEENDGM